MRVLMTTSSSSLMDGINRHVLEITSALVHRPEIQVAVCILHEPGDLNLALDRAGVTNWSLYGRNGHDLKAAIRFYSVLRKFNPDLVSIHVLGYFETLILKLFGRKAKIITTVHGISKRITNPSLRDHLIKFISLPLRLYQTGTIFISKGVHDYFVENEPKYRELAVIYNPIVFQPAKGCSTNVLHKLIGVTEKKPIIGTACRIADGKNPSCFVDVMIRVLELNNQAHAVVIGNGDANIVQKLVKKVSDRHVGERFHFLGYRSDAPSLVRELSCFIMTSFCEGMPTSLLECMAQKVPFAFMTGEGGLKDIEVMNEQKGPFAICVKSGEVDVMAHEITKLITDPERASTYANRAYEVGREVFDAQKIVKQLVDFYKRVIVKSN